MRSALRPAVLITRPIDQAAALIEALETEGFEPLSWPMLEIVPLASPEIPTLQADDWLIFVSSNAVRCWPDHWPLPHHCRLAAMGPATAAALQKRGLQAEVIAPVPHDSRALLQLDAMAQPQRAWVVRGQGGLGLLAQTLRERGTEVGFIELYQRRRCDYIAGQLGLMAEQSPLCCAVVSSNESLDALAALIERDVVKALWSCPLVLLSQRTAQHARDLGFDGPLYVSVAASDEAMLAAVIELGNSRFQPTSREWQ